MTQKFSLKYGYGTVLLYLSLFLAMLCLNFTMDNYEPFSFALYCAMLVCGLNIFSSSGLFLLAGGISLTKGFIPFAVFAAQGAVMLIVFFAYAQMKKAMKAELCFYAAAAATVFILLYGKFVYEDYIRALIAGSALCLLTFAMCGALRCLLYRAGRCRLTAEEIVFLAVAFTATGIGFCRLAGGYACEGIAILLTLLSIGILRNPSAIGCAIVFALPEAVVKSVAAGTPELTSVALLAVCCAVSLALLRSGKLPAALSFFSVFLLIKYADGAFYSGDLYAELFVPLAPCLLFACMPDKLFLRWSETIHKYSDRQLTRLTVEAERARTAERLFTISEAFREIENTFRTLGDGCDEEGARNAVKEGILNEVCAQCENRERCKNEEVDNALTKLVNVCCGKGKATLMDLPFALTSVCINPSGLLFCLNKLLSEYRRCAAELENAATARLLLADQARAVGETVRALAVEKSIPLNENTPFERRLGEKLGRAGVICREILVCGEDVSFTATGKYDVKKLTSLVSEIMQKQYVLCTKTALAAEKFCYAFRPRPAFDAAFGISSAKKEGESASGDTHSVIRIDERTFLTALSDGMGSGEYARKISETAISLLESFYRAGLPSELVLETVNRLLSFNKEESFACVDIAAVDLDSGTADIVKIGSPLGFVLTTDKIEILESGSLPLGILDGVRPTAVQKQLDDGDTLLFISDGITSAFGSSADLAEFLSTLSPLNPQSLTDSLLQGALERTDGKAEDDMTAVATRLFRTGKSA